MANKQMVRVSCQRDFRIQRAVQVLQNDSFRTVPARFETESSI